jgi:serine phosphatase RsbU (regulator of sigma subunit)
MTFQRALLPPSFPSIPGIRFAARYLPGPEGVEVGGDWYDVVPSGEKVNVIIGDVAGRGIRAATVMGRLQTAFRAYTAQAAGPAATAYHVDRLLSTLRERELATVFQLLLDPGTRAAEFVRAGHPPALLRASDGTVTELRGRGVPPIGTGYAEEPVADAVQLEPGSKVLLYTDGLIERRGVPFSEALERLRSVFAAAPDDPEQCIESVLDAFGGAEQPDDVAILAVVIE